MEENNVVKHTYVPATTSEPQLAVSLSWPDGTAEEVIVPAGTPIEQLATAH